MKKFLTLLLVFTQLGYADIKFPTSGGGSSGGGSGVTTVSAFSASPQTNGAAISGSNIVFGPADATTPGMVSTGAQTWAGVKTLTSPVFATSARFSYATASTVPYFDSNKDLISSAVTPTNLASLDTTTSLTTQLAAKAPINNTAFTGTQTGLNAGTTANGGDGKTIVVGNTIIRTGDGAANQFGIYSPSGGTYYAYENNQQMFTFSANAARFGPFALSRDWSTEWQMSKGTLYYGKGVSLGYSSDTAVGNVGAGEDDLMTKTTQANGLSVAGDRYEIKMWGTTGTGGTKTIKAYGHGTAVHTITTTEDSATWNIECDYAYTGASAGNYFCKSTIGTATATSSGTLAVAHTSTTLLVWKATGESGDSTTDDVIQKMLTIKHMKVGN